MPQEFNSGQVRVKFVPLESNSLLTYNSTRNLCIPDIQAVQIDILREAHNSASRSYFEEWRSLLLICWGFVWRYPW
jgi:hypothetical protein